jgi:hypothetical protein
MVIHYLYIHIMLDILFFELSMVYIYLWTIQLFIKILSLMIYLFFRDPTCLFWIKDTFDSLLDSKVNITYIY